MNSKKIFVFLLCFLTISVFLHVGNAFAVIVKTSDCATGGCTVESSSPDATICNFETRTESQVSNDHLYDYPYGLFEFTLDLPGGNACLLQETKSTVKTTATQSASIELKFYDSLHNGINMEGYTYRKYGPTPDNPTPHWYDFMWDGTTGAVITGNTITLHFVDGQRGDDDIQANGTIVDQGGQGRMGIPTMTEWGMIIFMMFAGLGAVYYLRRQRSAKS
jgi:hypothetical protein